MPPPSATSHLPSSHPAQRQRPKSPTRVLAEADAQWLFTEAELANTPSVQDGMAPAEERDIRTKGVNFIVQVGIMLKLPQLTLSTAAIFFQRFLMRASLKKERDGIPKLHHYQTAATALFLATKVDESCRKMRELVLAFCRVAQKNPNLIIDEQSKDWWRWRDCILHNEDVLLETLCFDLTVESPHRQLFDLLKFYGVEHNKRLRNQAWAFVTDSNNTQLCLLCTSRTIAVAALYAACRYCEVALPDDSKGRPWWEAQHVGLGDVRRALEHMCASYEVTSNNVAGPPTTASMTAGSEGERSIYQGLSTPMDGVGDGWDSTRQKNDGLASPLPPPGSGRRLSNGSSVGGKRERDDHAPEDSLATNEKNAKRPRRDQVVDSNGVAALDAKSSLQGYQAEGMANGKPHIVPEIKHDPDDGIHREEALRVENANRQAEAGLKAAEAVAASRPPEPRTENANAVEEAEGSEEGEVEE